MSTTKNDIILILSDNFGILGHDVQKNISTILSKSGLLPMALHVLVLFSMNFTFCMNFVYLLINNASLLS